MRDGWGRGKKEVAVEDIEKDRGKIKGTPEEIKRNITRKGRGRNVVEKESEDSVSVAPQCAMLLYIL